MASMLFIYNSVSRIPLPSKLHSEVAQFRNEDDIKIYAESVASVATITNQSTSESVLHRISRALVRNRTAESESTLQ
jgi:hypothetical protein